jgi:hypothetical protein
VRVAVSVTDGGVTDNGAEVGTAWVVLRPPAPPLQGELRVTPQNDGRGFASIFSVQAVHFLPSPSSSSSSSPLAASPSLLSYVFSYAMWEEGEEEVGAETMLSSPQLVGTHSSIIHLSFIHIHSFTGECIHAQTAFLASYHYSSSVTHLHPSSVTPSSGGAVERRAAAR